MDKEKSSELWEKIIQCIFKEIGKSLLLNNEIWQIMDAYIIILCITLVR